MFSLSRILTRSAAAAGQAVINELESLQVGNAAEEAASVPVAVGVSDAIALDPGPASAPGTGSPAASDPTPTPVGPSAPSPPPPGPPVVPIDAGQLAILEAATSRHRRGEPGRPRAAAHVRESPLGRRERAVRDARLVPANDHAAHKSDDRPAHRGRGRPVRHGQRQGEDRREPRGARGDTAAPASGSRLGTTPRQKPAGRNSWQPIRIGR